MSQNFLVIGSTGTVGAHVVRSLLDQGHAVRAATRDPARAPQGTTGVTLDLADASTFGPALEGADGVFLLSPTGHLDAHGLLAPFLGAATERASRVVLMTAQGVDFSDEIPLRRLEIDLEKSGAPYGVLRPTWFSDNFASYWGPGIRAAGRIAVPAADARSAFVDARDIGASAAALLTGPESDLGRAHVLTGPAALTYAEAAKILSAVIGREVTYEAIDDAKFIEEMVAAGVPAGYAQLLAGLFAGVRAGSASTTSDAVEHLTGRAPRSLETWARDHRAQFA